MNKNRKKGRGPYIALIYSLKQYMHLASFFIPNFSQRVRTAIAPSTTPPRRVFNASLFPNFLRFSPLFPSPCSLPASGADADSRRQTYMIRHLAEEPASRNLCSGLTGALTCSQPTGVRTSSFSHWNQFVVLSDLPQPRVYMLYYDACR